MSRSTQRTEAASPGGVTSSRLRDSEVAIHPHPASSEFSVLRGVVEPGV